MRELLNALMLQRLALSCQMERRVLYETVPRNRTHRSPETPSSSAQEEQQQEQEQQEEQEEQDTRRSSAKAPAASYENRRDGCH